MNADPIQSSSLVAGADVVKGRWIVVVLEHGTDRFAAAIARQLTES